MNAVKAALYVGTAEKALPPVFFRGDAHVFAERFGKIRTVGKAGLERDFFNRHGRRIQQQACLPNPARRDVFR